MRKISQIIKLKKWHKIVLLAWLGLLLLSVVGFFGLKLITNGQSFSAEMLVEGVDSPALKQCEVQCPPNANTPSELDIRAKCLESCKKSLENSAEIYTYRIKLQFDKRILKPHKNLVKITLTQTHFNDSIRQDLFVDSGALNGLEMTLRVFDIKSKQIFKKGENLGSVTYEYEPLYGLLGFVVKYLVKVLILCAGLWWIIIFAVHTYSRFEVTYPRLESQLESTKTAKLPLNKRQKVFFVSVLTLIFALFVFQFWLGFPGYHLLGDTYNSIGLVKNNWHPVFIAYVMQVLYALFGKHLFYLFLFNIVPFYAGIYALISGFYLRFRSAFALLLIFPIFIGNIYFQNFIQYHSFALPMMLFCLYSVLLCLCLNPQILDSKRNRRGIFGFLFTLIFFALLWRHNAIFSVFPAFLVIIYLWLGNRGLDSKIFLKYYVKFTLLSALLCLVVVIFIPKILSTSKSFPANHTFLHQIAASCVPNNDSSCFKAEWYYPHKSWEDVKDLYAKYPLNADPFNVFWGYEEERPFKHEKLRGLKTQWLKAIVKYPRDFLAHEMRFIKAMWIQNPGWIFDSKQIQAKASDSWHLSVLDGFSNEWEKSVSFSPLQESIYSFLYKHRIVLNHFWGVGASLLVMLISAVLLCFKRLRNAVLVCAFSAGFAGFFSAFFIAIFTPVAETRYMSPILALGICAVIAFIAFVCDRFTRKRARAESGAL